MLVKKYPGRKLIRFQRMISWLLVVIAAGTLSSGYGLTRHLFDRFLIIDLHIWLKWSFLAILVIHVFTTLSFARSRRLRKVSYLLRPRSLQDFSGWGILIAIFFIFISGLDMYGLDFLEPISFPRHVGYDIFLTLLIIIHVVISMKIVLGRKKVNIRFVNIFTITLAVVLILSMAYIDTARVGSEGLTSSPSISSTSYKFQSSTLIPPLSIIPQYTEIGIGGKVFIGSKEYTFDHTTVETVRPDIFNPGHFSMFDVLAHLNKNGVIDMEYHFDDSMNTHVIDRINGETDWWYMAYYSGGWLENNVFRMDHYLWKEKTILKFIRIQPSELEGIYSSFREEVKRLEANGGRLIIPKVVIKGRTFTLKLEDLEVKSHNTRNDALGEEVATALDVIMTMGDQGSITYELKWYESIGTASIVKSYWVEGINGDRTQGRCGFVYEEGAEKYRFFKGNHIHLPSDVRVINSPEYVEFFWKCV